MQLALFDFDGTLTTKGTYAEFARAALSPGRVLLGSLVLGPIILAHRLGLVSTQRARVPITWVVFRGLEEQHLEQVGRAYAQDGIAPIIRPEAWAQVQQHRRRGDRVVVVSASLHYYLEPWCRAQGFDLICNRLEIDDGRATGRLLGLDCAGAEKRRRVEAAYDLPSFERVYAYGDTSEDWEMLALAHQRHYRGEPIDADQRFGNADIT